MKEERLRELLTPFLEAGSAAPLQLPSDLYPKLVVYLELLVRWNTRTNLTAVRQPEEVVTRHFGESLFTALRLSKHLLPGATLLDFGSGAGFPGLPIQLAVPRAKITLAESQGKKAAFLREAVRVLEVDTEVWAGRVEAMPGDRLFEVITLRAVDQMADAVLTASGRLLPGGVLAELGTRADNDTRRRAPSSLQLAAEWVIPESDHRVVRTWQLVSV